MKKNIESYNANDINNFTKLEKKDSGSISHVTKEEDLWEIISSSSFEENLIQFDNINELNIIENYYG